MNSTADIRSDRGWLDWPRRADAWLDARGKWAWIAAMVAGFVVFFPLGLAILAWMIWGKQMFGQMCCRRASRVKSQFRSLHAMARPSGNAAFDNYRAETLRRLETEQEAFEGFMRRLRDARDKQEFDRFMEERAKDGAPSAADAEASPAFGDAQDSTSAARRGEY